METFVNVIFSIEMQENNQLITINIYLRAYYLCTIEATRNHQLSHLLNEAFFIYLVVVIVIICISWRKSKLIKISSFLLPYFEITQTFFLNFINGIYIKTFDWSYYELRMFPSIPGQKKFCWRWQYVTVRVVFSLSWK